MDEAAEREFRDFVAARQGALFRVALLLTGDREDAEDLLQAALAKLALHWGRLARREAADAYVRKILYHQQVSLWRARASGGCRPPRRCPTKAPSSTQPARVRCGSLSAGCWGS